jgi:hypothetical protein
LFGDEVADGALRGDTERYPRAFGRRRWGNQALCDEAIEHARLVERNQSGHGLAVVCDGHLLAVANDVEVVTETIS